ncbi:MAG: helix-turn-helix transcriptional regulator [Phoenicibacter congonensis]|uniref:Helix-turn-helix transcriptional regulator n=1 Tax=Phoenicibacter congonensis TaxID=1944646 RepID=A0AA43RJA9_9ACTN|nr:helix-turn-helix transcriptional regulator [Phoenicibacter congonensis]
MNLLLFYVTITVIILNVTASAVCFSAWIVSQRKTMLFAAAALFFYFLDVVVIFQDSLLITTDFDYQNTTYLAIRSMLTIATSVGFIGSLWMLVQNLVDKRGLAMRIGPLYLFICVSLLVLATMPESPEQRFVFYTMRAVFIYFILFYSLGSWRISRQKETATRIYHFRYLFWAVLVLNTLVIVEDYLAFIVLSHPIMGSEMLPFGSERNYAEELMVFACAAFLIGDAVKILRSRYKKPPVKASGVKVMNVPESITQYSLRFKLSDREEDVLKLILDGKDNSNIASTLCISYNTVKVHVHHILKKTKCSNRKDLIQDFWRDA